MRIGNDRFHLTYCTNVHPGKDWASTFASLEAHVPALKERLAPGARFGVGLRLSDRAARELLREERLARFKAWLEERGLYVFTINGFPYGDFHQRVVKDQVYAPDWRQPARVQYTLRLARVLAELLPAGLEGSISTSPLSYKPWLDEAEREDAYRTGSRHLAEVAAALVRLQERSGTCLHVDLEPEPDCLIENTDETIAFFEDWLLPAGGAHLAEKLGTSRARAEAHLLRHVRVCYDTCHFAVEYEAPADALARLREAEIRIGKIHLSAALKVALPPEPDGREAVAERLRPLAEATYLHQVIERRAGGALHCYPDLPDALACLGREEAREWRVHYHVPIFWNHYALLRSTQRDLVETLCWVRSAYDGSHDSSNGDSSDGGGNVAGAPHLEIETYTWDVLPPDVKTTSLVASIQQEYEWTLSHFHPSTEPALHA